MGGDRSRGAQGQADAVRPRAAGHRPRRGRAVRSTRAGRRPRARIAARRRRRADGGEADRLPDRAARSSRCSRSSRPSCPRATAGSSSRSGTASARSCSATATGSTSRAATCKPLDRYFPELEDAFRASLPERCVVDGEIVIVGARGLDFDALQMRLHPAASRVRKLAAETPASFVAFDLLADGRRRPARAAAGRAPARGWSRRSRGRRAASTSRRAAASAASPQEWFHRFEGAGLDGVDGQAREHDLPARQARDGQGQARAHARTAWWRASAGTSRARGRSSARCCSASTTTRARSTTSA